MISFVSLSYTVGNFSTPETSSFKLALMTPPPSLLPSASPLVVGTMLLRLIIAHTLPYINSILWFLAFFFAFLTNEDGTSMLSLNVNNELPLLAAL
jgi:hypothetical protein